MIYVDGFSSREEQALKIKLSLLAFHEGAPARHEVLPGGVVARGYSETAHALDAAGAVSPCSLLRRGVGRAELLTRAAPLQGTPARARHKAVYLGGWGPHYGHFLTEYSARLHALQHVRGGHVPVLAGGSPRFFEALRPYLGLGRWLLLEQDTAFDELVVPYPDMSNRGEIYASHGEVFRRVGRAVFGRRRRRRGLLYLTRSRLGPGQRRLEGEAAIEDYVAARGGQVVSPEQATLEEQVALVNDAEYLVGCEGSALHNSVFAVRPLNVICFSDAMINANFLLLEQAAGNNLFIVNALRRQGGKSCSIDAERAIAFLRRLL